MILSKIERLKDKRRYDLFFDGEFKLRVHEEILLEFGLRAGDRVGQTTLTTLQSSEEFLCAKLKAIDILNRRIRSEKELRMMLRNKEFHPHAIDRVITHLKEMGILDDQKYARIYANHLLSRKPAGKALLRRALRMKGLNSTIISNVLQESLVEKDEVALALTAAEDLLKRRSAIRNMSDGYKRRQKIYAYLAHRGFGGEIISAVMKTLTTSESGISGSDEQE